AGGSDGAPDHRCDHVDRRRVDFGVPAFADVPEPGGSGAPRGRCGRDVAMDERDPPGVPGDRGGWALDVEQRVAPGVERDQDWCAGGWSGWAVAVAPRVG